MKGDKVTAEAKRGHYLLDHLQKTSPPNSTRSRQAEIRQPCSAAVHVAR